MGDYLWRCMDGINVVKREHLENVIKKNKVSEVHNWFHQHFISSTHAQYMSRCPIVIIQGPTGCGKTSTLKCIASELKIPVKEYSETTDITAINYDLARSYSEEEKVNLSQSIDRRKALKFEHFVINSLRYKTLYPADEMPTDDADCEFDTDEDDGFMDTISKPRPPPPVTGVIIHIETPLTFVRTQRVLIQSLHRLLKVIKEISKHLLRRVAIVFETLEGESETISLPTKIKLSLGIQVFKFNPITRANMKKLIESLVKNYKHIVIDKETIEQLINDCDGDIRACINTLQLICNSNSSNINVLNGINNNSLNISNGNQRLLPFQLPASKKQKLHHEKVKQVELNPSLLRDNTRSLGFFHVLGKIFYQKRLYPDPDSIEEIQYKRFRSIDRPFPTENSTEYLANMLDVDPKNLVAWLHQHYHKFCRESNIDKAALFLENLSMVDTTSLSSTQSSQFYEAHNTLDQVQIYLAIESTVYSLYQDQTNAAKPSHKKTLTDYGYKLIKSSVESFSSSNNGELYSFNKPVAMSLTKVIEDHRSLLDCCTTKLMETNSAHIDPTKFLIEYVPYLNHLSKNWATMSPRTRTHYSKESRHPIFDEVNMIEIFKTLEDIEHKPEFDFETRHEKLLEMIETVEIDQTKMHTQML